MSYAWQPLMRSQEISSFRIHYSQLIHLIYRIWSRWTSSRCSHGSYRTNVNIVWIPPWASNRTCWSHPPRPIHRIEADATYHHHHLIPIASYCLSITTSTIKRSKKLTSPDFRPSSHCLGTTNTPHMMFYVPPCDTVVLTNITSALKKARSTSEDSLDTSANEMASLGYN